MTSKYRDDTNAAAYRIAVAYAAHIECKAAHDCGSDLCFNADGMCACRNEVQLILELAEADRKTRDET